LKGARIRLADGKTVSGFQGEFEVVSMTGTLSQDGLHIHLSLADEKGRVLGGHLQGRLQGQYYGGDCCD
jgi:hypothetical protein